jgi:hypothetical protein
MSKALSRTVIGVLVVIPILVFYWVVVYMCVDAPFQDDIDALLEPSVLLRRAGISFTESWNIIYTQDDERRIVMNRLVAWVLDKSFGYLDLRFMIVLGASSLLAYTAVLWQVFRQAGFSLLFFVPIPWLLFNVQFFDAIFWSMIPLQHVAVFVWGFVAIFFLAKAGRTALVLALIFAVFSIYSDVSGNFLLPVGILMLVVQRRWPALMVWTVVVGLVVFLYFNNLQVPAYRPSLAENLSKPMNILSTILALPGLWADPGPSFPFKFRAGIAILVGLLCLGFVLMVVYRLAISVYRKKQEPGTAQLFALGAICLLGITFATLALGRASYGLDSVFTSRYRHMYVHWLIMLYILGLLTFPKWTKKPSVAWGMGGFAFIFCLNAYIQYWVETDYFRKVILTDAYEWEKNRAIPSTPIYQTPRIKKLVDDVYEAAYESGVYRGPHYPFEALKTAEVKGEAKVVVQEVEGSMTIYVNDIRRGMGKDDGVYVILSSPTETHIFPTKSERRSLRQMLMSGSYYYPGANSEQISKAYLKSPSVKVEIGVIHGDEKYRLSTSTEVKL